MEIFIEQYVILPLRIGLEFLRTSVHRSPPRLVSQEDPFQPIGYFTGDFEQVHQIAGTSRTLNFEIVTVVKIERHQRADQECVNRHPDRTTPVGVTAEHARSEEHTSELQSLRHLV